MTGRPPTFDHDECRALYASSGWTKERLMERYGVSIYAISYALDARLREYAKRKQQEHPREQPCVNGCGRMSRSRAGERYSGVRGSGVRKGMCKPCSDAARCTAPHGTETRYKRCKCALCRAAARDARARRRDRERIAA